MLFAAQIANRHVEPQPTARGVQRAGRRSRVVVTESACASVVAGECHIRPSVIVTDEQKGIVVRSIGQLAVQWVHI